MIYIIVYDIGLDKLRNKVSKRLIAEGYVRIQLSVFAGIIDPMSNANLWSDIKSWIKEEENSKLYSFATTKNNFKQMNIIGKLDYDIDYLTGSKHTMIV